MTYFEKHVQEWARNPATTELLEKFGIPKRDLNVLLGLYADAVASKSLSDPESVDYYYIDRFAEPLAHRIDVSVIYSTIFFKWAVNPTQKTLFLAKNIPQSTLDNLCQLYESTDRTYIEEEFSAARKMRRKVIMHVGPTNSGKTYHALRAFAAAQSGVYAGPLRLLAHEIWERINLGQIAPLGSESPDFKGTNEYQNFDKLPHADAIRKHGNPMHARLCNMVTGEEQKIVGVDVGLLSCTVEMVPLKQIVEVGVIDEIQMIGDTQRGSAWTAAVLGLPAMELHLCGEETAVPIVQELLKHTGDEIVVKRYERLTPLTVEETSLEGDWSKIQKGDCVVAFARSNIFKIKQEIEKTTKLRCAVIYGRLPPEIRSEQAALFNDPDSGYDVLVGSDAIGMGLNLKIRRVVFDTLQKSRGAGGGSEPLSISTVKQIAGRAGRFGMHTGSDAPGGFTTTLAEKDMAYLRQALATPFIPLPLARVSFTQESFDRVQHTLPLNSSTATVLQAHHYIGALPRKMRYHESDLSKLAICDFIDKTGGRMTTLEKARYLAAPVAWRDPHSVAATKVFMRASNMHNYVDVHTVIETSPEFEALKTVEKAKDLGHTLRNTSNALSSMESLHKALILYIWMSFRAPIMYPHYDKAVELKIRVERALQWTLVSMSSTKTAQTKWKNVSEDPQEDAQSRPVIPSKTMGAMKAESLERMGRRLEITPQ